MNRKDIELFELMNLRMMKNTIESLEEMINERMKEIEDYEEHPNGSEDGLFTAEDYQQYRERAEKELEKYLKEARELTSEYIRRLKK